MKYNGKTVLVTGAGRGIGRAIAKAFGSEGANIVGAARTEGELKSLVQEVGKDRALAVRADMTSEADIRNMVQQTVERFGRIDILVNNAGIGVFKNVVDLNTEEWDRMFNVNMRGVFLCCRYILPYMIKQESGMIYNIASLAGKNSFAGGAGYAATKWALLGFSKCLMLEVRNYNIRVVTVCPGSVDTSFHSDDSERTKKKDVLQAEDVAKVVLDTASLPARATVSDLDIRMTSTK